MMSEAEALRTGYAMLDDHNDEEWSGEDEDDEFDGFTIEDENGIIVDPIEDEEWDEDLLAYIAEEDLDADAIDIYDDGPESTAEPEGW